MTTRAGLAGLLTGLIITIFIYVLFAIRPEAFLLGEPTGSSLPAWIACILAVILAVGGGLASARWSGSAHPGRCAALGALAGGLAGTVVFCLWGAALAGLANWVFSFDQATNEAIHPLAQVEFISAIIQQTLGMFVALFMGGSGLGALGGWMACPRRGSRTDVFDKSAPQMALNASITAVPASIIAATVAAAIFSRLADFVSQQTGATSFGIIIADLPLAVSLLLVLISHFILTLVVPHEARQAEHLCGMDEVKMAAYVGIGAAPFLVLLLLLIEADYFSKPLVVMTLLASAGMSMKSLYTLFRQILPGRAAFPMPQEGWQKTEARLFGTIAASRGPRLVVLCFGCALAMILPLYVSVIAALINLINAPVGLSVVQPLSAAAWRLFLSQALASLGLVAGATLALTTIYLFYLSLGRWFRKRSAAIHE